MKREPKPIDEIVRDLRTQPREQTLVFKFGGSTTGAPKSLARLREARLLIESKLAAGYRVVPVFSALRRPGALITDLLLNFREILGQSSSGGEGSSALKAGVEEFRRQLLQPHIELARDLELISESALGKILDKRMHTAELSKGSQALVEALMSEVRRLVAHALALYRMPPEAGANDYLVAGGERLIVPIIAAYFNSHWTPAYFKERWNCETSFSATAATARDVGILTNNKYGDAHIDYECLRWVHETVRTNFFQRDQVPILTGFDGIYKDGESGNRYVTTLGRSGSDYTATFLGFALRAEATYLLKDTPGVLSANPKLIPGARPIPYLSYQLAVAAGNIQDKAIGPARDGNVPLIIAEVDGSSEGTRIGPPTGKTDGPVLILDPLAVRYLVVDARIGQQKVAQILTSLDEFGIELVEFSRSDQGLLLVWQGGGYEAAIENYLSSQLQCGSSSPGHHLRIVGDLSREDYMQFVAYMLDFGALSTGICWETSKVLTTTVPAASKEGILELMTDLHQKFVIGRLPASG